MTRIDRTISGLDEALIRQVRSECVLLDKTLGDATNEAFMLWLEHIEKRRAKRKK